MRLPLHICFVVRTLRRSPSFTIMAVLALAVGIGANTAIFSVVNGILLRPFPFPESDQIVRIFEENPDQDLHHEAVTGPNFVDWRSQSRSFAFMAAASNTAMNVTGSGEPEVVSGVRVSSDFFRVLGIEPRIGRTFAADEFQPSRSRVVILSDGLWKSRFASDSSVIGRAITLNELPYQVIGVMPPRVQWPFNVKVWVPYSADLSLQGRRSQFLSAIGRLRPGTTIEQARREMSDIAAQLERSYPSDNRGWTVSLIPFPETVVGQVRRSLLVLFGAVGFVLLIACVNVTNLLLARASAREKEVAVRIALGASRTRLVSELLSESLLLSVAGALMGIPLALWGTQFLLSLDPVGIPRLEEIGVDRMVLVFALSLSVATTVLCGLVPALRLSRLHLHESLKAGGLRQSRDVRGRRSARILITAEIAFGLVLLVGAGLMIRSLRNLQSVDLGFEPKGLLGMRISLGGAKYATRAEQATFFNEVIDRLQAIPYVNGVAAATDLPLSGISNSHMFTIAGRLPLPPGEFNEADYDGVSPGYFRTMNVPIVSGREFESTDRSGAPRVAVVSEAFVRRFFPNQNPIGARLRAFDESGEFYEIVGVAADVHHDDVISAPPPKIYACYLQNTFATMSVVVRTRMKPESVASAIRQQIWSIDKDQPINSLGTIEDFVASATSQTRLTTTVLTLFAVVALLLSLIGICGVMSYFASQRTQEIGIRIALGARRKDVLWMVVREGILMALCGEVAGLIASLELTRVIQSLLYQVSPTDFFTFAFVLAIMSGVAILAGYIPARIATRIDPLLAIRGE
jgi:putative ABC transport system permease protein